MILNAAIFKYLTRLELHFYSDITINNQDQLPMWNIPCQREALMKKSINFLAKSNIRGFILGRQDTDVTLPRQILEI